MAFNKQETQKTDTRAAQNAKNVQGATNNTDKKMDDKKRYPETEAKKHADKDGMDKENTDKDTKDASCKSC